MIEWPSRDLDSGSLQGKKTERVWALVAPWDYRKFPGTASHRTLLFIYFSQYRQGLNEIPDVCVYVWVCDIPNMCMGAHTLKNTHIYAHIYYYIL